MILPLKKSEEKLPDIALQGANIFMRPPRLSDWHQWSNIRRKNSTHLRPFEPSWPPNCLSEEFFKRRLVRQAREWVNGRGQSFLIFKNSDNRLIGGMNINQIIRGASQSASLGYWIDKDHEGKGLMKETVRLTLNHCFTTLQLHRVNACCISRNERSKFLLLSCGFEKEGYAKSYLKINGSWQDHILFGYCENNFHMLQDRSKD